MLREAGELRIPFTSGILVGIGESPEERVASLEALAAVHAEHGHLQEVILQNYVPHPSYYGREPAEIADAAQGGQGPAPAAGPAPEWATPITLDDMRRARARVPPADARRRRPDTRRTCPTGGCRWWRRAPPTSAGCPPTATTSRRSTRSPRRTGCASCSSRAATRSRERLCVYPQYMDGDWLEHGVLDVIKRRYWSFIPRRGSGRREERTIRRDLVPAAIARAREGAAARRRRAHRAVRRDAARGDRGHAPGRRRAAPRARGGDGDVRREPQHQRLQRLRRRLRVLRLRPGQALAGRLRARPRGVRRAGSRRRSSSAPPRSACSPASTRTGRSRTTRAGCGSRRRSRPQVHLHAYSPMEVHYMAGDLPLDEVFERLRAAGLGSTPGTAAEVLHDGVRERISPNKLPVARWVEIMEASAAAGFATSVTVMFGHVEEPWELAEHMRVVRELQERTGGFNEFVPLSFIPFHTLLGRTHGIEEISREENLKHTAAFRLALGKSVRSLQASWVKMGLDAATESLRWGVNDLGGTLMEESISRLAGSYHGVKLDPEDLIGAAHRAGPPGGRAHHPVRDSPGIRARSSARAGALDTRSITQMRYTPIPVTRGSGPNAQVTTPPRTEGMDSIGPNDLAIAALAAVGNCRRRKALRPQPAGARRRPPRREHRPAHGARQPQAADGGPRGRAGARHSGLAPSWSRCSTWTASSATTTPSATRRAMLCSRASGAPSAPPSIPWGSAYRLGGDEFCVVIRDRSPRTRDRDQQRPPPPSRIAARDSTSARRAGWSPSPRRRARPTRRSSSPSDGSTPRSTGATRRRPDDDAREALHQALREREPTRPEHLDGVAALARATGRQLGLDSDELDVRGPGRRAQRRRQDGAAGHDPLQARARSATRSGATSGSTPWSATGS